MGYLKILLPFALALMLSLNLDAQQTQKKFSKEMLDDPVSVGQQFERKFNLMTVSKFVTDSFLNFVLLENGYSKSRIINPSVWPPKEKKYKVVEIQVIYSQYPRNKDFWLTNYHRLLADRLKELFALDSSLNDKSIEWTMVLQTDCKSESEAEKMRHGIAIYYAPIVEDTFPPKPILFNSSDSINYSKGYVELKRFDKENIFAKERRESDSTAYKVLDRHKEWQNSLVVCDWTASMYAYSLYVSMWHCLNYKKSGIKYISLFNDGGNSPDFLKKTGKVDGVYFCHSNDIHHLVKLYKDVINNGNGGAEPENDVEAILRSIKHFPAAREVVLIADNSCIRDFTLLGKISKPVKVILVGARDGINSQYINLAYRTGGSIHTIEQDIEDLKGSENGTEIKLQGFDFIFDSGKNGYDYKSGKPEGIPDCSEFNKSK